MQLRLGGEMDITSAFEADFPGSNPGRGTRMYEGLEKTALVMLS
jgi:hypothetical protein